MQVDYKFDSNPRSFYADNMRILHKYPVYTAPAVSSVVRYPMAFDERLCLGYLT
jgi:hypothetical protein